LDNRNFSSDTARLVAYAHPMSPAELLNFIHEEQQMWKPVIAQVGLSK